MGKITRRQVEILQIIRREPIISSSEVFTLLEKEVSLVTVKRELGALVKSGYILRSGEGRAVKYSLSVLGKLFLPIDARSYTVIDPDKRSKPIGYDFSLFKNFPKTLFIDGEKKLLDEATQTFKEKTKSAPPAIHQKELERFVIELSWKSSKIEGNTYTLLDTERLLREGIAAKNHTRNETTMIINHKKAFDFILANKKAFGENLNRKLIEEVHKLLISGLSVGFGIRKSPVGITGTTYRPLDNKYQIAEALEMFFLAVNKMENPHSKALLILLGMSYIQPFEDGNKRSGRLIANAVLLASGCAPLSYRSVDEISFREAILVFYETESIIPMKEIFIDQYLFAAKNYLVR